MSIWDKIKGALFEEQEYEVEELVPESKKKKKKKIKNEEPEEVKVAKQIDLPEQQVNIKDEEDIEPVEEDYEELESFSSRLEKRQKYTMDFDEEDFKEEVEEAKEEKTELPSWREAPGEREEKPSVPYEGIKEKQIFKPTPIISPIYGILDKNYRKEDVVSKREVRLSTTSSRRPNLDAVREKAYGEPIERESIIERRSEKLAEPEIEELEPISYEEDLDKGLIDLNRDGAPTVETVTVGDAEEYFDELGLEYNVDYKDEATEKSKQKARRSDRLEEELEDVPPFLEEKKNEDEDEDNGDNLFDLIEAMYEDEEDK